MTKKYWGIQLDAVPNLSMGANVHKYSATRAFMEKIVQHREILPFNREVFDSITKFQHHST